MAIEDQQVVNDNYSSAPRLRVRGKLIWQSLETPDLEAEKKGVDDLASKGELQQTMPATSG